MNFDDLKNELNNPKLNFDNGQLILHFISKNLYNDYYNRAILKTQLEILELSKGTLPSEIEEVVDEKLLAWTDKFSQWHKTDFVRDVLDFSHKE
ncbi:hypothetical protein [Ichthyenterobacterium magnum]|uniref:Uncharacterized protein n=1 Tax=Ichthyenterobacterium magnum TaxID=1230530 RepID=A0A420DED2_9FLAO|nr:hypothetical protein [Ichthyenterobacterium magnum]RKE90260.1 hypothetical protein BXY80_2727 [Ichthyenterobacterium magnum]